MPDGKIHILQAKCENEEYSRLASDAGISVQSLLRCSQPLEEYYMNLKKEGR